MAFTFNPFTGNFDVISTEVGANPTASLGLAAVNGSATTFLRSDGAPALDVGISPTWTGTHTFTESVTINLDEDEVGSIIEGHSTQTNLLSRWQQSDGTVVLEIEDDGTINAGDDAVASDSGHAVYSGTSLKAIFGWDQSEGEMGLYSGGIATANLELEIAAGSIKIVNNVGFYDTTPIAQQTGVAVSAAGVHAALVALGLITA